MSQGSLVYVTVRQNFSAGHRLHNPALSDAENRALYGRCNNPSGHGHNYVVELTLRGSVDPSVGRFVSTEAVRSWLWTEVLDRLDHRNLNSDVEFMRDVIPTSENLARVILDELGRSPYAPWLYEVRLLESENNIATCRVADESAATHALE